MFPAEIVSSTQIICRGVPNVVAPGPGTLVISLHHQKNTSITYLSANMSYFNPIDFAISKRPYINELDGNILLRFDSEYFQANEQFKITAELPAAGPSAQWEWDTSTSPHLFPSFPNVILPLSFATTLPPNTKSIHNDISVTVTRVLDGTQYVRSRRFHRVPPPLPNSTVVPVQVDHTKRSLLVNGKTFRMQGYYMGTDHPTNNSFWLKHELSLIEQKLVPVGLNVGLFYDLQNEPLDVQRQFLDGCHRAGFKVIYPIGTGKVQINHGGPFDQPAMLKELIANITFVKDHPAILGYEICDDCCSTTPDISLQSQIYQLIKNLDPYHVTIGAVNCGNSWMFTDTTPSWLTPGADILSLRNLPEAVQPNLQLSLDVVMQENYNWDLSSHGSNGTWAGGVSNDGFFRHGVEFEPLTNCPGTWLADKFAVPSKQFLSLQWLGLVTANMHDSLAFILTEDYEYLVRQSGLFSERVSLMSEALMAPFGSVNHPFVYPSSDGGDGSGDVRTRGWSLPKDSIGKVHHDEGCAGYIVVVNTNEKRAVNFKVIIVVQPEGKGQNGLLPCNATRMFDGESAVVNVGRDGFLSDSAGPAETNVYCLVKI